MTRYIMAVMVAAGVALVASSAMAGLPDPVTSTVPVVLVGAEKPLGGSITWDDYTVVVRDVNSAPVVGATVTIDFSTASGDLGNVGTPANPYTVQVSQAVDCPTKTISLDTVAGGIATFEGGFGGAENMATVEVRANGVLMLLIPVRSTDIDGVGDTDSNDLNLFRQNFFNFPLDSDETDYSDNGSTGSEDLNIFREAFFGATGINPPC